MNRLFYDNEGTITQQYTNIGVAPSTGTYIDVENRVNIAEYRVDPVTKTLVHMGTYVAPVRSRDYQNTRRTEYGPVADQLGLLWHDINAGVFGEGAKSSTWYQSISAIKAANPKP